MSKFVLTAQLKLQAPTNARQVVNQMQGQLGNLSVPVQVSGAGKATKQLKQVTAATNQATNAAQNMGKSFGLALKRFAAFTVASRAVSLFTNTLANATEEAIDFQREVVKIAQVTGKSVASLKGLSQEVTRLATNLGTSSKELLGATRILAQAGIQAGDLKIALEALAKTTLAPTFEDISKTAEGAVAILAQFGKGVGALKEQLGAINAVAGQFAVESGDLIGAIRRTGGVFRAAGGDLNEFLGLFTSIRATTRESAESIATGLRTILTRIQRPATIQYLKELGVSLTDLNGRFVGPFEAIKRLSKALGDVPAGDLRFVQIAEELGGFRQIGKVIPLLQEFETAEKARQAAVAGASSLDKDAATAQQALAVQIQKTKEEFLALVRSITETTSFQVMVKTALGLASAFIKVAEAIKPLIPLIGVLAAAKFAKGITSFGRGVGSAIKGVQARNQGGKILAFARGGMVPGSGNRDTVPAMLQPGEFVIRKSSVKKIGANNLANMNVKGYNKGGSVIRIRATNADNYGALTIDGEGPITKDGRKLSAAAANAIRPKVDPLLNKVKPKEVKGQEFPSYPGSFSARKNRNAPKLTESKGNVNAAANAYSTGLYTRPQLSNKFGKDAVDQVVGFSSADAQKVANAAKARENVAGRIRNAKSLKGTDYGINLQGPFNTRQIGGSEGGFESAWGKKISEVTKRVLKAGVRVIAKSKMVKDLDVPPINTDEGKLFNYDNFLEGAQESVEGFMLEGIVGALTNAKIGGGGTNFDFPDLSKKAQKQRLKRLFVDDAAFIDSLSKADAKRQRSTAESGEGALYQKVARDKDVKIALANKGGVNSSKDTVPALLTPGEFVINKKSAQSIGYANLNNMNKKGVTGFNKGGPVQMLNRGGKASGGGGDGLEKAFFFIQGASAAASAAISALGDKSKEASDIQAKTAIYGEKAIQAVQGIAIVLFGLLKFNKFIDDLGKKKVEDESDSGGEEDFSDVGPAVAASIESALSAFAIDNATITIQNAKLQKGEVGAEEQKVTPEKAPKTPEMSLEDQLKHTSGQVNRQKDVVKANEESLAEAQKEKVQNEQGITKARSDVNAAADEKERIDTRKEKITAEYKQHQKTSNIREQVNRHEQEKAAADSNLKQAETNLAKKEHNQQELSIAQTVEKKAQFEKSELERKQASGMESIETMRGEQDVRAGKIANLNAQRDHLLQEGKGTVENANRQDEGGINEVRINLEQVEQEIARLEGESKSAAKSIEKAEKNVANYDAEIAKQEQIITESQNAQKELSNALNVTQADVDQAAAASEKANKKLTGARQALADAEKDASGDAETLEKMRREVAEANKQSAQADRDLSSAIQKKNDLQKKRKQLLDTEDAAINKLNTSKQKQTDLVEKQVSQATKLVNKTKQEEQAKKGVTQKSNALVRTYTALRGGLSSVDAQAKRAGNGIAKYSGKLNNQIRRLGKAGNQVARFNSYVGTKFVGALKFADRQVRKLSNRLKGLRGGGGPGGGGGGIRGLGKGLAKAGGAAIAAAAIAQQIASAVTGAVSEIAGRRREQAEGSGDIRGAGQAAKTGALAEGLGRAFTLGGAAELVGDFFNGTDNFATGLAKSVQNARASSAAAAFQTRTDAAFTEVEEGRGNFNADFAEGIGKSSAEALAEINAKTKSGIGADDRTRNEALKVIKDAERKTASGVGAQAASMEDLVKNINAMGDQTALTKDELLRLAKNAFAAAEAQRAVARANFDNLKVMSAFNKANLGVNQFINSLKTGSSTLADSIATVEAAATNMNMGGEGSAALESIRQRIIDVAAGGDEKTAQGRAITRQFSRADAANDFMASIQGRLSGLDLNQESADAAKQQLESALLSGVQDADIRAAISAQIAGMGDIRNQDISGIIAQVSSAMGPLREGALNAAKALLQHEQTITQLTQQRRQAEVAYIAAQRQAIDQQLAFAKSFEEFGGAKLTADQKLSANIAKFNLGARDAGVSELRTGSVQDIQNVASSIQNRLNQQQIQRATGGFRDVEGVDADRIKETNSAIKDLTGFIQSQIQATKEQIAIIEKRNKQEQDSINALLKGDVSGFVEGQGAAGAASALRSGDAELLSLFGPAAQAAALEQLKAEGADAGTLRTAGELVAGSVGLDARSGQVLSGTTDELNELRAQGQALAQAGAQVSQMAADSAAMEISQAEMAIENANLIFKQSMEASGAAQERAEVNVPGLRRGGVVYANRGIFVPRGTDTVPAMLTPGEFVVNRAAVQRGNNLQILRAMNANGQTVNAGPNSAANLSGGGSVGYYAFGDLVQNLGGVFGQALPNLENIFRTFTDAVQTLSNTQIGISVSKPIDVNVRLLNDNILSVIDKKIRDVVLDTVAEEIPKYKSTGSGDTRKSGSLMNQ